MEEDVDRGVDMEVGELERACEGELEVGIFWRAEGGSSRARWQVARERSVVVDVEL